MKITLDLTEDQIYQIKISLKNDWVDNDQYSKRVINNIIAKLDLELKRIKDNG